MGLYGLWIVDGTYTALPIIRDCKSDNLIRHAQPCDSGSPLYIRDSNLMFKFLGIASNVYSTDKDSEKDAFYVTVDGNPNWQGIKQKADSSVF